MDIVILIVACIAIAGFAFWIAGDIDNAVGYWEAWHNESQEEKVEE